MRLISVTPAPCAHCGNGNTLGPNGEQRQFVDLERDINWNDPLILCEDCCLILGGMVGMQSPDSIAGYKEDARKDRARVHDLEVQIEQMQKRARRLGIQFTKEGAEEAA